MNYDVFVCHASEDQESVATPLATQLRSHGLRVWLDQFELTVGDSLRRRIDEGLANSEFGVVILSPAFFGKEWANRELDALASREVGSGKTILPVWHNVEHRDIAQRSPLLADKLAVNTIEGIPSVASAVVRAIRQQRAKQQPSSLHVFSHHLESDDYMIRWAEGLHIESLEIIDCSSYRQKHLVASLLRQDRGKNHLNITLFVQTLRAVRRLGSTRQESHILDATADLNELRKEYGNRIQVQFYNVPTSVLGVRINRILLSIGWLVWEPRIDKENIPPHMHKQWEELGKSIDYVVQQPSRRNFDHLQLWGHSMPRIVVHESSPHFPPLNALFERQLKLLTFTGHLLTKDSEFREMQHLIDAEEFRSAQEDAPGLASTC